MVEGSIIDSTTFLLYFVTFLSSIIANISIQRVVQKNDRENFETYKRVIEKEIEAIKKRTETMEDKIPIILTNQARLEVMLSSAVQSMDHNFKRIFDKLDAYDTSISHFYKDYDLHRKEKD